MWPLSTNCGQGRPGQTPRWVSVFVCVKKTGRWWVGAGWRRSYCLGCHGWVTPEPLRGPKGPRGQATAISPWAPRPWEPRPWSMSAGSLGTLGATGWAIWTREQETLTHGCHPRETRRDVDVDNVCPHVPAIASVSHKHTYSLSDSKKEITGEWEENVGENIPVYFKGKRQ